MAFGYLNIIHNWVLYAFLVSGAGLPKVEDGNSPFPLPDIYFVKIYNIKYTSPAGDTLRSSLLFFGSGVLTTDGQFIVSRSLVEPWNYAIYNDTSYRYRKELLDANIYENTFNYKITGRVQATSIKGDTISFRIEDRKVNTKPDRIVSQTSNGQAYKIRIPDQNSSGLVYFDSKKRGITRIDKELSCKLKVGDSLRAIGYDLRSKLAPKLSVKPIDQAVYQLQISELKDGNIPISKDFYLYTGTPVFFLDEKENEYKVIGLVGLIKNEATVISLCNQ